MAYVSTRGTSVRWSPQTAVAYALNEVRSPDMNYRVMCDRFMARCYGFYGSGYVSAHSHWHYIPSSMKHPGYSAPVGAFHFWDIGSYGHVALNVGKGLVASNDIKRVGKIDVVPVTYIGQRWGARYLGWTEPYLRAGWGVNPNRPPSVPPPVVSKPVVHVSRVQPGANNSEVLVLQKALRAEPKILLDYSSGPGVFGPRTRDAYAKWQRLLGFSGSDADGKPGITSLRALGARHNFLASP